MGSRADTHARIVGLDGLYEHLGERQALIRQIVISQCSGLIAIIQEHDPPCAFGRAVVFGTKAKVASSTPQIGLRSTFHWWVNAGNMASTSASLIALA